MIQISPAPDGKSNPAEPLSTRSSTVDLDAIRRKLEQAKGPQYWKGLEEVAETEEFRKFVEDEFPDRTPDWNDPSKRRTFLKLMGASLALAGVTACTKQPPEYITPYVRQPPEIVPGKPLFFATARPVSTGAVGILVESHMGRPTKIEGNPDHPGSMGAVDPLTQGSILDMYDPDRSQAVLHDGEISSWVNFVAALSSARDDAHIHQGAGLRFLTAPMTSPTFGNLMKDYLAANPQAKWHRWEPVVRPAYNAIYHLDAADVIVSLDADFLRCAGGNVRYAREFADKRRLMVAETPVQQKQALQADPTEDRPEGKWANETYARDAVAAQTTMNRLYVAEGTRTVTGASADHRIRMRTSDVPAFGAALASALGAGGQGGGGTVPAAAAKLIPAIVRDLQAHRGASLVIAGEYQPPAVHALAHAMNEALGNVGKTVSYTQPVDLDPVDPIASLKELIADMNAGRVKALILIGVNPLYDAPADLGFAEAFDKVELRMHLGLYVDETASLCHWHVNAAHYLESWGDARAYDGTITIMQPLIAPLYDGHSEYEIMSVLNGHPSDRPHDVVKAYWESQQPKAGFTAFWQISLNNGVVANSAFPVSNAAPNFGNTAAAAAPAPNGLEIVFRPDPTIWDGQFSNNGWLQEMPKPQSKMTWDNAVWVSPATAQRLKVENTDIVEIEYRGRKVQGPIWVMPGHADESITLTFGYGRRNSGRVGQGIGFDAYALRTSDAPWIGLGAQIRKIGKKYWFASTQLGYTMDEREPLRMVKYADYQKDPAIEYEQLPRALTLQPDWKYTGYKWGMTVDLNACTGCMACEMACVAENNIPVVGKDQVARGRIMHWIRIDRYYSGLLDDPEMHYQPVPCMQCEMAPCELVCPVAATVHSGDGLNQMVYNRCVGTRYCSNNCPYKVRRFNFYLYSDWYTQSLYGLRNPDVTVRSRGVMEKCTYCVQRIAQAKIASEKEDRRIVDGEIVTACQQACPTKAIVFGDINDPNSRVAKLKAQPRNYSLLESLDTRPRTTYLARVLNPNPEIEKG
jgi:MoCo/4Fe-4S cofactor protein with predicted Tat translocation signal